MGFIRRQPQQRGFLQALARQGGTHPGMPRLLLHTDPYPWGGAFFHRLVLLPFRAHGAPSLAAIPCAQRVRLQRLSYLTHFQRRIHPHVSRFHLAALPSGLPTGSKTDASFEALVSPEHHALALAGSRSSELAPTLTIAFQDNAVRRFTWRPEDGRLDLHPAAALPAQP